MLGEEKSEGALIGSRGLGIKPSMGEASASGTSKALISSYTWWGSNLGDTSRSTSLEALGRHDRKKDLGND